MASTWARRMELSLPKLTYCMWFVYIIQCEDNSLYTGCTNDLERRFDEHRKRKGGKYTSSHRPIKILFSEQHNAHGEALKRERQIKGWSHNKKIKFIQNQNRPG